MVSVDLLDLLDSLEVLDLRVHRVPVERLVHEEQMASLEPLELLVRMELLGHRYNEMKSRFLYFQIYLNRFISHIYSNGLSMITLYCTTL